MSQRSNSQCFSISPLNLESLGLRESEYFLPSPDQETSTLHHESFAGQVSASSPQQLENNNQSSAETEHDSDESLHLVALFQSTSEIQSNDDDVPGEVGDRWRPSFLTRTNLFAFIATMALLIAGLETIWGVSQKNSGIASADASLQYLWTYGPSAILTFISAIWNCVEYEAKAITPWLRKAKAKNQSLEYLTIDYVSMNTLVVPFRSLARRDFLVTACAIVSLSLNALIVMSTSLITLTNTNVTQPAILRTRFVDDPSRLSKSDLEPLLYVLGHELYGLPWQHGTSEEFVYQSIGLPVANITEFHAIVEGLSFGLDCQVATSDGATVSQQPAPKGEPRMPSFERYDITFRIDISIPDCNSHVIYSSSEQRKVNETNISGNHDFGFLQAVQCANQSQSDIKGRRLAWVFGSVDRIIIGVNSSLESVWFTPKRLQCLICNPSYNISQVRLEGQDNNRVHISSAEGAQSRSLVHVEAWDIMNSILDAHIRVSSKIQDFILLTSTSGYFRRGALPNSIFDMDLDDITAIIAGLHNETFQQSMAAFNIESLRFALQHYCRLYTTFLVHDSLMEPEADLTAGSISFQQQRLIVQTVSCQVMVGFCIASIVGLLVISVMASRIPILSGDPAKITRMAALLSSDITQFPRGFGAVKHLSLKEALQAQNNPELQVQQKSTRDPGTNHTVLQFHQPTVLHPLARGAIAIFVIGILILLEVLLRHSDANEGFGPIGDQTYVHYLWTSLPALIFTIISLYFSSVDSELRALSPIETMGRKATAGYFSLNLRLLGRLYPRTIYKEIQTRKLAAGFASTCSLIASFLTVTSGSIFFEVVVPTAFPTNLTMVDTFSSNFDLYVGTDGFSGSSIDGDVTSPLVLRGNLSYPANTYEGFLFPSVHWPDQRDVTKPQNDTSTFDVKAILPAMQSRLICHKHSQSDIKASILHRYDPRDSQFSDFFGQGNAEDLYGPFGDRLLVNITDEICDSFLVPPELWVSGVFYLGHEAPRQGVFAMTEGTDFGDFVACTSSNFVFIWGSFESDSVSATAVTCNITLETVDVDVVLFGHDLSINPAWSPSVREDSWQDALPRQNLSHTGGISPEYWYPNLLGQTSASSDILQGRSTFLDPFFSLLTSSRIALPLNALANLAEEDTVIAAICLQHSILIAQSMNSFARFPLPSNTTMTHYPYDIDPGVFALREDNGTTKNTTSIEATVEDYSNAQRRVVMNATATRVLEGLLAATLALALLAWAFMPKTAITPHPATSIMGMVALLVDGDLVEKWQSSSGQWNVAVGDDEMFRLGWGPSGEENKGEAGKRFGIWTVPKETQKALP